MCSSDQNEVQVHSPEQEFVCPVCNSTNVHVIDYDNEEGTLGFVILGVFECSDCGHEFDRELFSYPNLFTP